MLDVLRGWLDRHLSDEEAVLLIALLTGSVVILLTMGTIVAPLLTSVVFAYVMQGVITRLKNMGLGDGLAIAVTYVLFLGSMFAFLIFVLPRVWRQMRTLFSEMPVLLERGQAMLFELPEAYPELISTHQVQGWTDLINGEAANFGQWLVSFSISQLPVLASILIYALMVPIVVFFLLRDKDEILHWCLSFLPRKRPLIDQIGAEMELQMANYVRGKVLEIIIMGISTYVLFKIFDLDYAALLALLVGLSVVIPYIGIVAVSVPVAFIAYVQFGWTTEFLYFMSCYGLLQSLDGFLLVPWLFSEVVNLHPVAIIAAVLIFGSFWGLWGAFFAIPLATLVKAIITAWPKRPEPLETQMSDS